MKPCPSPRCSGPSRFVQHHARWPGRATGSGRCQHAVHVAEAVPRSQPAAPSLLPLCPRALPSPGQGPCRPRTGHGRAGTQQEHGHPKMMGSGLCRCPSCAPHALGAQPGPTARPGCCREVPCLAASPRCLPAPDPSVTTSLMAGVQCSSSHPAWWAAQHRPARPQSTQCVPTHAPGGSRAVGTGSPVATCPSSWSLPKTSPQGWSQLRLLSCAPRPHCIQMPL